MLTVNGALCVGVYHGANEQLCRIGRLVLFWIEDNVIVDRQTL